MSGGPAPSRSRLRGQRAGYVNPPGEGSRRECGDLGTLLAKVCTQSWGWSRFFPGEVCARSGSRRSRGRESIILMWAGLWVLRPPARGGGGPGRPLCPRARGIHVGGRGLGGRRGRKGSRGPRWLGTPTCTCLLRGPEQPDAPSCELPAAPGPDPGPFSLLLPRACLPLPMFLISAFHLTLLMVPFS